MTNKEREYREEVAVMNLLTNSMSEIDDDTDVVIDRLFSKITLKAEDESKKTLDEYTPPAQNTDEPKLTKEQIDFIKNLSYEMKTQDNRDTAQPYGLVIGQKERQVTDYDNASLKAIHWNEGNYDSYEEFIDALEEYYLEDEESHPVFDYIKKYEIVDIDDLRNSEYEINELISEPIAVYGYQIVDNFDSGFCGGNFFMTDKSAKTYIEANRHNLKQPFTYGVHLYRNPEIDKLYEVIHKLAEVL